MIACSLTLHVQSLNICFNILAGIVNKSPVLPEVRLTIHLATVEGVAENLC